MKIALIGPGFSPIPPVGWGAVEIIIWNYKQYLEQNGHDVVIFNTLDLSYVAQQINDNHFDFVHLHYEEHAPFFNKHLKVPYCVTGHYGWILQRDKWEHEYYDPIFNAMIQSPGIIALSPTISQVYSQSGHSGFIKHLRNGVDCNKFSVANAATKRAVYIGKIEPRKRQYEISQLLCGKIHIDFIGEVCDSRFKESSTNHHLGSWSKEMLHRNLTNYSVLILASLGEASPLVVLEALAAGVSIVVSKQSQENLTPSDFVRVVNEEDLQNKDKFIEIVNATANANFFKRNDIIHYARTVFDFTVIVKEYIQIIEEFNRANANP